MRTNGGPKKSWQTPARFWEPVFELRPGATLVGGWDAPEWTAEDPTGNHGQFLGVHQRVLKYSATFYPSATNVEATKLIGSLPAVAARALSTNVVWNLRFPPEHTNLLAYGVFPPGRTIFGNALAVTNHPGTDSARDSRMVVAKQVDQSAQSRGDVLALHAVADAISPATKACQ